MKKLDQKYLEILSEIQYGLYVHLYGNDFLTIKEILICTIRFIKDLQRFFEQLFWGKTYSITCSAGESMQKNDSVNQ